MEQVNAKLNDEVRSKNFELFIKKLNGIGIDTSILVEKYGEVLKNATYTFSTKDNACGDGELINTVLRKFTPAAISINDFLPEEKGVDKQVLIKTCLLSQISKAVMVSPNDNKWEIENRGLLYKFNEYPYALKMGTRSLAMCVECGIKLTDNEIEALTNLDREEDKQTKFFSSPLSIILKQAMELTDLINRK